MQLASFISDGNFWTMTKSSRKQSKGHRSSRAGGKGHPNPDPGAPQDSPSEDVWFDGVEESPSEDVLKDHDHHSKGNKVKNVSTQFKNNVKTRVISLSPIRSNQTHHGKHPHSGHSHHSHHDHSHPHHKSHSEEVPGRHSSAHPLPALHANYGAPPMDNDADPDPPVPKKPSASHVHHPGKSSSHLTVMGSGGIGSKTSVGKSHHSIKGTDSTASSRRKPRSLDSVDDDDLLYHNEGEDTHYLDFDEEAPECSNKEKAYMWTVTSGVVVLGFVAFCILGAQIYCGNLVTCQARR